MNVTATMLANDSKAVLDQIIHNGESVVVQRHGRSVAEIRRKVGVSRAELARRLKACPFTKAETAELRRAIETANKVYGYAGGD